MREEFEAWFMKTFPDAVRIPPGPWMAYQAGAIAMREQCQREKLQERLGDRAKGPVNLDDCGVPHLREE